MTSSQDVIRRLDSELRSLEAKERKRTLRPAEGIDFTSNDYLALTHSSELRSRVIAELSKGKIPLGSGGSRLLRGNHEWHEEAEAYFATWQGTEASLFFTSGYAANMAVLTAIPTRRDVIIYDTFVHASIKEGIHASFATKRTFEHNSIESLVSALDASAGADAVFVVVESLYSMDGDEAPLDKLARLSRERGFALIVDEAHATGLFGGEGRGLIDERGVRSDVFASVHPCGKALAGAGAFVCGSDTVKSYLLNRARTMIFTTALPPIVAYTLTQGIEILRHEPARIRRVFEHAAYVRERLTPALKRWTVYPGRSPIIPLVVGMDAESVAVAEELHARGMDVRPIRPPTVAEGSARFRLTVNSEHTKAELDLLCDSLIQLEEQFSE